MRSLVLLFSFPMILQGQSALITGSGRGIGRAIALLFAKEGASVFLCARSHDQLVSTAAEISHRGGQVAFTSADVTREEDCRRIVDEAREKFGPVTILVNNAGQYGPVVPVEEYPLADFDQVIAVHLRAAFLLTQLVLPEMYAHEHGVILNISSLSAKSAFSWSSGYAAATAGMLGLTRVTAAEAARKGAVPAQ
jgi:NAD(P)-dependent dehydrogenase (short-subunit alcohol dehydrogenase family)